MLVKVKETTIRGKPGYDLIILDDLATVGDYLGALNQFIEEGSAGRIRHPAPRGESTCLACNVCCQERIPLTSIDLAQLAQHFLIKDIFDKFIYVYVHGCAIDITLKLGRDGLCRLNSPETRLCSLYKARPFVCQTYICCGISRRAEALREAVVNTGEDQLVRDWLRLIESDFIEAKIDEAEDFDIREEDWGATPFEGKTSYDEVLLKDLCTTELWKQLRQKH